MWLREQRQSWHSPVPHLGALEAWLLSTEHSRPGRATVTHSCSKQTSGASVPLHVLSWPEAQHSSLALNKNFLKKL